MGKRNTVFRPSKSEIRQSSEHHYEGYVKKPSKAEAIWLQDSYGIVREVARNE